jgi:hypothetical protein
MVYNFRSDVTYLGHIVSRNGSSIEPTKRNGYVNTVFLAVNTIIGALIVANQMQNVCNTPCIQKLLNTFDALAPPTILQRQFSF